MPKFRQKVAKKRDTVAYSPASLFKNEEGAIDLASIMVGIIVIGLVGGVIAATVFAIIPWSQDNAAKQQLDSISSAQSAYMGLSSSDSLPTYLPSNSYANSYELKAANLLSKGDDYCTIKTGEKGGEYEAFAQSASGKTWTISSNATQPKPIDAEKVPASCGQIIPYVDETPSLTVLTYKCDTTKKGIIPMNGALTGVETWTSGSEAPVATSYANQSTATPKTLTAGVEYRVTFDGTYKNMDSRIVPTGSVSIADCLRSVDQWGMKSGVTSAAGAFANASNLTSVPAHIPPTIINYTMMFLSAFNFNDPNISQWDTSNVTGMGNMFDNARIFNQPLDNWDTSKVTSLSGTFLGARQFNQPINDWDTSKVRSLESTFNNASAFNQPLNNWDVSNVTNMAWTFNSASAFNQDISAWDVSQVTSMQRLFSQATSFQSDLSKWNVSNVTDMSLMFENDRPFNSDISNWDVSNVTNMTQMFNQATSFKHDLSKWDTSSLTAATKFVPASFPNEFMPAKTSK